MPEVQAGFSLQEFFEGRGHTVLLNVRLYQGTPDLSVSFSIQAFTEANFLGYDEQELREKRPTRLTPGVSAFFESEMVIWEPGDEGDWSNSIGGFFVAAMNDDDTEEFVIAQAFRSPVLVIAGSPPLALVVRLWSVPHVLPA